MKKTDFLILLLLLFMAISGLLAYCSSSGTAPASAAVTDSREEVELPVLMYHSLTDKSVSKDDYILPKDQFESDLAWLAKNGFTAVSAEQLVNYAEKGSALPDKPVLITFDDGYYDNYSIALPLLEKYHAKAVISVIGKRADVSSGDLYRNLSNSSLSWGEIALLSSSGHVEAGSHTYDLHSASGGRKVADKKAGEKQQHYEAVLREDLLLMQQKVAAATGRAPLVFAWPYGAHPKDGSADAVLKEAGFKISLTSYQQTNRIRKGDPDSLLGLNRFLRTPDFDTASVLS